ncbi:TetR family transcriptional regulator C-terminal domain-containing protein [Actinocrispum sp. NPDC049592]|uniref:TetR/AcrR family transcriptional regulator n=1 Tax=Actinocrispum sp. NPDC049592 TaxID=3154835 RepID=UPI00343A1BEA
MPKRVDHEQRRREITHALWRIATEDGLKAVTLRRVAAEAGISMNLVQYYFSTKDQMVRYSLDEIIKVAVAQMTKEIDAAKETGDPRAILRAAMAGMLPVDEGRRQTSIVYCAYMLYAVTDEEIRAVVSGIPRALAPQLTPLVQAPDPLAEVESLIALTSGLAVGILVASYTPDEALGFLDYRLDQLFG